MPRQASSTRTRPYTATGVKRLKCIRCGAQAHATWQACSDGNVYRPLCKACDIQLNEMVLGFMGIPGAEIEAKMGVYRAKLMRR